MALVKTKKEIELLSEGGRILADVLQQLSEKAVAGTTGQELDLLARELFMKMGVTPSFLGYGSKGHAPFPAALCVSVNDAVVHGMPNTKPFKEGDIVKLDLGLVYQGMYLDSARTVAIGKISHEARRLMDVTLAGLKAGIEMAIVGNTTGHIGQAIQEYIEGQDFGVVRQLVGHGVGHAVHEEPQVPNFGVAGKGTKLVEGMVIAIEPMVTVGDYRVETDLDGWTIKTSDGSLAAHEEDTVAITAEGPKVLTRY